MVVENNNMKAFEPTDMVKFLIKAFLAVFILSHTFDIALAIFDVAGHVVASAVSVINESTAMDIGDFSHLRAELMDMPLFEVVAMWAEVQFVSVRLRAVEGMDVQVVPLVLTWYAVMAEPPWLDGGCQFNVACPLPTVAHTSVGALGAEVDASTLTVRVPVMAPALAALIVVVPTALPVTVALN